MTDHTWRIRGPHFVNCNCDYNCPCQFWGRPGDGTCRAMAAWRIDEGHHRETGLDGLCAINTWAWPGPIHEGHGSMQSIIDERASEPRQRALLAISKGKGADAGAVMLQIYRAMCKTVHAPLFLPIRLEEDVAARSARVRVPGVLESSLEPIKNKVTGALHRARIDLPLGKEFTLAEVASGTTRATGRIPLDFANTHAHLVENRLTSQGVAPWEFAGRTGAAARRARS